MIFVRGDIGTSFQKLQEGLRIDGILRDLRLKAIPKISERRKLKRLLAERRRLKRLWRAEGRDR